jgi:hypothetical protein
MDYNYLNPLMFAGSIFVAICSGWSYVLGKCLEYNFKKREEIMKQNKAISWGAATFIASFTAILFAPLAYLFIIGKSDRHVGQGIGDIELFSVDSQSSGSFSLSYGLGAIVVPAILGLLVWGILQIKVSRRAK